MLSDEPQAVELAFAQLGDPFRNLWLDIRESSPGRGIRHSSFLSLSVLPRASPRVSGNLRHNGAISKEPTVIIRLPNSIVPTLPRHFAGCLASQSSGTSEGWWRGLDSNQRTLARADLQSAAFNHSATSPYVQAGAPNGGASIRCQRAPKFGVPVAPRRRSGAPFFDQSPGLARMERVKGIEPSS